ncbi:MAG: hypothetical protein PVI90_02695 [Desulfobacteraceae bacterium]|jgi:hypothetical protein
MGKIWYIVKNEGGKPRGDFDSSLVTKLFPSEAKEALFKAEETIINWIFETFDEKGRQKYALATL